MAFEISQAQIIRDYIIDEGLMSLPSNETDWPLYIGSLPDIDGDCGCIYNISGRLDGRLSDGTVISHRGISIHIRADDNYDDGYNKMESIAIYLELAHNDTVVIDGITYQIVNITRQGNIIPAVEGGGALTLQEILQRGGGESSNTKRRFLFELRFLTTINRL